MGTSDFKHIGAIHTLKENHLSVNHKFVFTATLMKESTLFLEYRKAKFERRKTQSDISLHSVLYMGMETEVQWVGSDKLQTLSSQKFH